VLPPNTSLEVIFFFSFPTLDPLTHIQPMYACMYTYGIFVSDLVGKLVG
jgi:hypothetical protein